MKQLDGHVKIKSVFDLGFFDQIMVLKTFVVHLIFSKDSFYLLCFALFDILIEDAWAIGMFAPFTFKIPVAVRVQKMNRGFDRIAYQLSVTLKTFKFDIFWYGVWKRVVAVPNNLSLSLRRNIHMLHQTKIPLVTYTLPTKRRRDLVIGRLSIRAVLFKGVRKNVVDHTVSEFVNGVLVRITMIRMKIRDGLQPKPHGAVSTGFQNFVDMNRHENLGNVFAFHQVSKQ